MSKVELSVIVPVYNVENYLKQCLDSLINQTLKEIEIIIVNDGSTDRSEKIINEYSSKHNNIRVINQSNQGLSSARNNGIKYSRAEYIAFIDSDDYIDENMLKEMLEEAKKKKLDIVICNHEKVYANREKGQVVTSDLKSNEVYEGEELLKKFLNNQITPNACDKIYKKSIFIENNIVFPSGYYHEDLLVTYKLLVSITKGGYINKSFYKYRSRENSITTNLSVKNIEDMEYVIKEINDLYRKKFGYNSYLQEYIEAFNIINFNICVYMAYEIKEIKSSEIIKRLYDEYRENNFEKNKVLSLNEKIKFIFYKLKMEKIMWKIRSKI